MGSPLSAVGVQGAPAIEDPPTRGRSAAVGSRSRIVGVDLARGIALIGMMATHTFETSYDNGSPTLAAILVSGRSAATFVLVAGVSLAFLSGGRRVVRGPDRIAVSAGLAVRAVLIGALGLALGLLSLRSGVYGILAFYGLLFLLAIPLLWLRPRWLALVTAVVFALGPLLLVATAGAGLPYAGAEGDPTFTTLLHDPGGLLVQLFVTGEYPAVVYLGYIAAGLAIGRLDLSSRRVAWWLLGGGAALAITARAVSLVLLYPLGGLARLIGQQGPGVDAAQAAQQLLWEAKPSPSWWYLALPAPHSHTPIDLLHTLGSAMVVVGAALLLVRVRALGRVLAPLVAAGTMTLTLYTAHLLVLGTGVGEDNPGLLFLAMVVAALVFAPLWRWRFGQGPLERLVTVPSTAARRAVANHLAGRDTTATSGARPALTSRTSVYIGAAAIAAVAFASALGVALSSLGSGRPGPAAGAPGSVVEPLPSASATPGTGSGPPPAAAAEPVADTGRYCALSDQVSALEDTNPGQPAAIVAQAGSRLDEMPRVAPAEIRASVTTMVDDLRARARVPAVAAPDVATLQRAETTVEAFEEANCPS